MSIWSDERPVRHFADHECQRCNSQEWTWCDYRGCSVCFEPEPEDVINRTPEVETKAVRFEYVAIVTSEPILGIPSNRIYGPYTTQDEAWQALVDAHIIYRAGAAQSLCGGWSSAGVLPLRPAEGLKRETP